MSKRLLQVEDWEGLAREAKFKPAAMADHCMVSLRQLERFFARHFNETPREWTTRLKCRIALQLIREGYSNKAVVAELSFSNHAHFCHQFKRIYGVSPQSFSPSYGKRLESMAAPAAHARRLP